MCGRFFNLSSSCLYAFYFLSLSFSFSFFPPCVFSIFLSFSPWSLCIFRRQNVGLSDGWIYFRTRLSTSPTRDLCENRGPWQTFKRGGDYSYLAVARWGINDGGCVFSVKRGGVRPWKKYIRYYIFSLLCYLISFPILQNCNSLFL